MFVKQFKEKVCAVRQKMMAVAKRVYLSVHDSRRSACYIGNPSSTRSGYGMCSAHLFVSLGAPQVVVSAIYFKLYQRNRVHDCFDPFFYFMIFVILCVG